MAICNEIPQNILTKAQDIKLVIFDVDGVLTNGCFYLDSHGAELKAFHTQDGLGFCLLQNIGITVAIISGRQSVAVTMRMQELGIKHVYQGQKNKLLAYQAIIHQLNLQDKQVACVGDDLPDLTIMQRAGLSIAVANAVQTVKKQADWVTKLAGGAGAAREVCDMILEANHFF